MSSSLRIARYAFLVSTLSAACSGPPPAQSPARPDSSAPATRPAAETPPPDAARWNVALGNAPVRGGRSALVTIVEFGDFQCPFTKRVQPTLDQVRSTYGDKVRIVWHDEPLPNHLQAIPAAELAREARAQKGDVAFWSVHDAIFAAAPALEDPVLERIAATAGLDVKKAMDAVHRHEHEKEVRADIERADSLRAKGTPHFFINGRRFVGAQPLEAFRAVIDEEMARAEALVAAGTKAADVYDAAVRDGQQPLAR